MIDDTNLLFTDAEAIQKHCNEKGEACYMLKRAVETIAKDLDAPDPEEDDGEPETLHKRAFSSLKEIVASMR